MPAKHTIAEIMDISERMQSLEEFHALTDIEKDICFQHVHFPASSKAELATRVGCSKGSVYAFFHSKKWDVINLELAKQQIRELVQLSIQTLRSCMLNGTSAAKLEAATRVLVNNGLLLSPHGKDNRKTDNKMIVVFNDELEDPSGNKTPIRPSCEAEGNPRIVGALSHSSGGPAVGENNASH